MLVTWRLAVATPTGTSNAPMALLVTQPVGMLLTSGRDIDFSARRLQFAAGLAGVVQRVRTKMLLVRGEMFFNLDLGVPWLPREGTPRSIALLGSKFSAIKARAALRPPILTTPGVLGIAKMLITFDGATRTMATTWQANTVWGDTPADLLETTL